MTQEAAERTAGAPIAPKPDSPTIDPSTADWKFLAESAPPGWLRLLALAAAAGVLAFGMVGLLLAVNGWYRPALAFPLAAAAWVALIAVARPAFAPKIRTTREAHVYAAIGVAAILAITAWNSAHASQHVLINRDGGDYANTARWIARDGSLSVEPRVGPFAQNPTVGFASFGIYEVKGSHLQFQFAHLLPVVLAGAFAIGGDAGLFHAPAVLGGIALLAFFVLALRLFRRPLFALSAMLALAFLIPQVSFTRDSYSEIPSQILLFTALWLIVTPRGLPGWRVALVSGLFLGALEAARIDAIVFLISVPVFLLITWLRAASGEDRRAMLPSIGAFAAGLVPGLALGLIDLTRHSGSYWNDLYPKVKQLYEVAILSAVVCIVVAALWRVVVPLVRKLPWPALANVAAVLVGSAGFVAWFVRPQVQHLHNKAIGLVGGLQAAEHVAIDPTRNYFERSMIWMSWYLGPVTLAVAVIGAAFLARELLLGRRMRVIGAIVILAPDAALYIYKASAVPDHVWVTRRFLVGALPLLVLLALGFASALVEARPDPRGVARFGPARFPTGWRVAAVVFAISAVAYPLYAIREVSAMTEQRGFLAIVKHACTEIGPNAAVVVLEKDEMDLFDDWVPQAFRSWCGAEVGVTRGPAHDDALRALGREWSAQGRQLFVVAKTADAISKVLPDAKIVLTPVAVNDKFLRQTLTHRPDEYMSQALGMAIARVPSE